jgi:hypothetical protein
MYIEENHKSKKDGDVDKKENVPERFEKEKFLFSIKNTVLVSEITFIFTKVRDQKNESEAKLKINMIEIFGCESSYKSSNSINSDSP